MAWPPRPADDDDGDAWAVACAAVDALPASRPSTGRGAARDALETLIFAAVMLVILRAMVGNYVVDGQSMQPSLADGERIWITRVETALTRPPSRGDIVVFQSWGQDRPFVKRVVGLPGETVEVRDGRVWVNGMALEEPYLTDVTGGRYGPAALGTTDVFVLGDNRDNSADSRTFGPLSIHDIEGTARLRYWPPDHAGLLRGARPVMAGSR
jgi:signal peptidase I